jgi:hypothetical protein
MSQGDSHYPIQQFLRGLIEQYGPTPENFVRALGYWKHTDPPLQSLRLWLTDGQGYKKVIRQIAKKLPNHADELYGAIAATKELRWIEAEAAFLEECKTEAESFIPFVHAMGDVTVPNGICIFGMTGGHRKWTRIEILQPVLDLPLPEQLARLPELMYRYRRKYSGLVPFFGKLTGFKFVRCLDHFNFDQGGNFIEHVNKPYRHGEVGISLR